MVMRPAVAVAIYVVLGLVALSLLLFVFNLRG
jgi:hypothetical protein